MKVGRMDAFGNPIAFWCDLGEMFVVDRNEKNCEWVQDGYA